MASRPLPKTAKHTLHFIVKFRAGVSPTTSDYPHVVLAQDNWDDYGYKTTFSATLRQSKKEKVELGNVKILQKGQTAGYTPMPRERFNRLALGYYSLGDSLDYYETLFRLGPTVYRPYLEGLRDVAYSENLRADCEDLEGYKVSLLRFSGAERTIADVTRLFERDAPTPKRRTTGFKVTFQTRLADDANVFEIPFDFRRHGTLPNRINVLVGHNGTGKTRLLSNLAIVTSGYGYARKEELLEERAGKFVGGTPPPFKRVVVISYSAFDTFVIPGRTEIEKARLRDEGEIFGYIYCGLRERADNASGGHHRRVESYRLKTPDELEQEFLAAMVRIQEAHRLPALMECLRPLLRDASFQRIGLTEFYAGGSDNDGIVTLFRSLSSGHKIVLKIIAELTSYLGKSETTLVLIDEPETHLHPPLLAALLKSLRTCLDRFDAYAVVATHSPVVLQETPARYVRVVRRTSEESRLAEASIETFGENIGVITQDVFSLDDGSTDWHDTLRELARKQALPQIEEMFGRRLGFGPRSYVASLRDDPDE